MDPALEQAIRRLPPEREIEAAAVIAAGAPLPPDLRPVATFGAEVITGRVRVDRLAAVRAARSIRSLKAARVVRPADDPLRAGAAREVAPRAGRWPAGRGVPGATGAGCLLAFLDWGCDFAHPNLRAPDGRTRLRALWDQRGPGDGNRWGYGRVLGRERIDAALASADPYAAVGYHPGPPGAHGTHVMDIAAGSGRLTGSTPGFAPAAALAFVHLATGLHAGEGDLGDSVRILEALDFVRALAAGSPFVVNMSLGRTAGDHTGRSCVERGMDALLEEAPGRCVVQSAGNYFGKRLHAGGVLGPGRSHALEWIVEPGDPTANELELWYPGRDRFLVEITAPGAAAPLRLPRGGRGPIEVAGETVGFGYHRECDPLNGDHHVDLFLERGAPPGTWQVTLVGEDVVDGRWHAWIERDAGGPGAQSRFRADVATDDATIGSIATGRRTLIVGAVDPATGAPAPFSSRGPSRDGRVKPDLVAPGEGIVAACSTAPGAAPGSGGLIEMSGTSMAAPHVAGAAALLFAGAARPLNIAETRLLLLGTARRLSGDPMRSGAGALDTEAALGALRRMFEERKDAMARDGAGFEGRAVWTEATAATDPLDRELTEALGPIDAYDVVGWPSAPLAAPLRAGDVLLRANPADPARPLVARIVGEAVQPPEVLGAAEAEAEGDGLYAEALQRTPFGWSAAPAYRRVTTRDHRVPAGQVVIRQSGRASAPVAPPPAAPPGYAPPDVFSSGIVPPELAPPAGPGTWPFPPEPIPELPLVDDPFGLEPSWPDPTDIEADPTPSVTVAGKPVIVVRKRGGSPARKAITLKVDLPFAGNATLTWPRGLQLFATASGGTELTSGARFTAAQLNGAGVVVHGAASAPSLKVGDLRVTLTLPGSPGAAAHVDLTAVEVTLDVFKSRTAPGVAPAALPLAEKLGTGRFVQQQDGAGRAGRARLLVRQPSPLDFADDLIVTVPAGLRLFSAETGGTLRAGPVHVTATDRAAGPVELWVEGAAHSATLSDPPLELGVEGEPHGDSARVTVVELTSLTVTVAPTPPLHVRAGMPAAIIAAPAAQVRAITTLARDTATNAPLVLIRNAQPSLPLTVVAQPAGVPLRWEVVRDPGDAAEVGKPSAKPLLTAGTTALTQGLGTDARGLFQVRAFVDCNGTGTFDAGEPALALNVVLVDVVPVAGGDTTHVLPANASVQLSPTLCRVSAGVFDGNAADAGIMMDILVDVIGGGADGTLGIAQIGGGLVNDMTSLDVSGEYRTGATVRAMRLEAVSNGAAATVTVIPGLPANSPINRAMVPATPPATTPVPARLQFPLLDTIRPGAGTGGGTATMNASRAVVLGPRPAPPGKPHIGLRVRLACMDSPGTSFLRAHLVTPAALLTRIQYHLRFRASFCVWTADTPRTYNVLKQHEWNVDADVTVASLAAGPNLLPASAITSAARPVAVLARAQDAAVEVRPPSDIDAGNQTVVWDATH